MQVMTHMNVIKCYAWEDSFLDRLMNIRRSELEWIKKNSLLNGINTFIIGAVPVLVTVATFAVYISMGNTLTAATAFTSISLFNVLRMPLIMLPQVISQYTTAVVCLRYAMLCRRSRAIPCYALVVLLCFVVLDARGLSELVNDIFIRGPRTRHLLSARHACNTDPELCRWRLIAC